MRSKTTTNPHEPRPPQYAAKEKPAMLKEALAASEYHQGCCFTQETLALHALSQREPHRFLE